MKNLAAIFGLLALVGCATAQTTSAKTKPAYHRLNGTVISAKTTHSQASPSRLTTLLVIRLNDGREVTAKKTYVSHYRGRLFRANDKVVIVANSQKRISWIAGQRGALFGPMKVLKFTKKSR